jgi:hypothetical protein
MFSATISTHPVAAPEGSATGSVQTALGALPLQLPPA